MEEKYTCPRCGFIFKLELCPDESHRIVRCLECETQMNIPNRFQTKGLKRLQKKVHYLHKSLLN